MTRQVVGVPSPAYLRPVAEALQALGHGHALVVHGDDGADEVSLTGPTTVFEVRPQRLETLVIHPEDAGLRACRPADLAGGDADANAAIANRILDGVRGPAHDFVVINAAAALIVSGRAGSLREGADQAREALLTFRSRAVLDTVRRVSQEAA